MNTPARVFIGMVITAGLMAAAVAALQWRCDNPRDFALLLALGAIASALKLRIPGMTGSMTPGFVFVLMGTSSLSLGETVLICLVSSLVQTLWRPKTTPKPVQVAFNAAIIAAAGAVAHVVAHFVAPQATVLALFVRLGVALAVLFALNITAVSTVVCLIQNKPLRSIWQWTNYWALPYYGMGTLVTALMVEAASLSPMAMIVLTPMLYLIHQYYSESMRVTSR